MIGFSSLGVHGRLGNQLHQYALLKAVSEKTGFEIALKKDIFDSVHHGQKCLLENFKLPSANFVDFRPQFSFMETGYRVYEESVFSVKDNTDFFGHFEHQKYASDIRDILLEEFALKDEIFDSCQRKLRELLRKEDKDQSKPLVVLHIRRGDLVDAPPEESSWAFSFAPGTPYGDYYSKAIEKLPDCNILVFSGGARMGGMELEERNRIDIEWCRDNIFKDDRFIFAGNFNDIETFYCMTNCDYNITSYGSTFSWWGSFLNPKSVVFAPRKFFPTVKFNEFSEDQFYPPYWSLI